MYLAAFYAASFELSIAAIDCCSHSNARNGPLSGALAACCLSLLSLSLSPPPHLPFSLSLLPSLIAPSYTLLSLSHSLLAPSAHDSLPPPCGPPSLSRSVCLCRRHSSLSASSRRCRTPLPTSRKPMASSTRSKWPFPSRRAVASLAPCLLGRFSPRMHVSPLRLLPLLLAYTHAHAHTRCRIRPRESAG